MSSSNRLPRGAQGHRSGYARPDTALTPDGKPVREVLSYARRGSRLTPRQHRAWDAHHSDWLIHDDQLAAQADWSGLFGRDAPLIVDIGSGVGEATVAVAAARPECNVLSVEVWRPGVAEGMHQAAEAGLGNVRWCMLDAVWLLRERVTDVDLAEVLTFFPDPWHKSRHHKRRLINAAFGALIAERLGPTGVWRIATDWAAYAEHIAVELATVSALTGGITPRWEGRPPTKFERKGLAAGRTITDFTYRRA